MSDAERALAHEAAAKMHREAAETDSEHKEAHLEAARLHEIAAVAYRGRCDVIGEG